MTQPSRIDGLPGLPDLPKLPASPVFVDSDGDAHGAFIPPGDLFTADQMNAHGLACYEAGSAAAAQAAKQVPEGWQPIETAPKDGTPIIGFCVHSADSYYVEDVGCLTDYGARAEGLSHVEDGAHVLVWGESYEVSDGWENPSCTIPAGWELSHDCEVMANPTHWMPLPSAPSATSLAEAAEAGQVEAADLDLDVAALGVETLLDALLPGFECVGVSLRVSAEDHAAIRSAMAGARTSLRLIRNAIQSLAAAPASPQAPAPQAVVGEASDVYIMFTGIDDTEEFAQARATLERGGRYRVIVTDASPEPSAAPHQGADALREAALIEAADALFDFQEIGGFVPKANREEFRELCGAAIVDYLHRAALAQHQAPQQGEQHERS